MFHYTFLCYISIIHIRYRALVEVGERQNWVEYSEASLCVKDLEKTDKKDANEFQISQYGMYAETYWNKEKEALIEKMKINEYFFNIEQ